VLIFPSNNHEREIVRIVDQITIQGGMSRATALTFAMSRSDSRFLMEYVRWRIDHPIPEPSESSLGSKCLYPRDVSGMFGNETGSA